MSDTIDLNLRVDPFEITIDIAELRLEFPEFSMADPGVLPALLSRSGAYASRLSDLRYGLPLTLTTIEVHGNVYRVDFSGCHVADFEVTDGSVKAYFRIVVALSVGIYSGIATYPEFKEGFEQLSNDIEQLVRFDLAPFFQKHIFKHGVSETDSEPSKEMKVHVDLYKREEWCEQIEEEIRDYLK